jgi:YD repeat-containing protein
VTDRDGHVTIYRYNSNGLLESITLPDKQVVNGQLQTFTARTVSFQYQQVSWDDHPHFVTDFDRATSGCSRRSPMPTAE